MTDRIQGILNRASDAPKFSGVRWILGDGVLTNYMQSFVDDTMKRNAEFQSKAGVSPKIVRKSPTKCCPWCDALVGEYKYPDDVPDDVYKRHDNCNCIVEFYPGDGKKQDVWSKQWSDEAPKEVLKERKTIGLEKPKAFAEYSEPMQWIKERMAKGRNIAYKEAKPLKNKLSDAEIIDRVGGGDTTSGSCSSAAFAFAGNKCGFDVLDFRGGASQKLFASKYTARDIANLPGVKSKIIASGDYIKATHELLDTAEDGKMYYLATGKHAAIVRKVDGGFEYLELQSPYKNAEEIASTNLPDHVKARLKPNGFHKLDDSVLFSRFGCEGAGYSFLAGNPPNVLIDIESLKGNAEFQELLGYINTTVGKQKKGYHGSAK